MRAIALIVAGACGSPQPAVSAVEGAPSVVLGGDPRRDVVTLLAPRAAWLRAHRVR
jgi:hypothetical protein